jgi:hypothetical protein
MKYLLYGENKLVNMQAIQLFYHEEDGPLYILTRNAILIVEGADLLHILTAYTKSIEDGNLYLMADTAPISALLASDSPGDVFLSILKGSLKTKRGIYIIPTHKIEYVEKTDSGVLLGLPQTRITDTLKGISILIDKFLEGEPLPPWGVQLESIFSRWAESPPTEKEG